MLREAVAETMMDLDVAVIEDVAASVAVMLWVPLVAKVAEKFPTPPISPEVAGIAA